MRFILEETLSSCSGKDSAQSALIFHHHHPVNRIAAYVLALLLVVSIICPVTAWADDKSDDSLPVSDVTVASAEDVSTLIATDGEVADEGVTIPETVSEPESEQGETPEGTVDEAEEQIDVTEEQISTSDDDAAPTIDESDVDDEAVEEQKEAEVITDSSERVDEPDSQKENSANPDEASSKEDRIVVTAQSDGEGEQKVPLPKGAKSIKEGTYIIETYVANKMVLGVSDKTPRGHSPVTSQAYSGSANQKWIVKLDTVTGWYRILLSSATRELALGKAKDSDALELLYPEVVGDRGLWAFVANGSWFNLVNRSMSNKLLAIKEDSKAEDAKLVFASPSSATAKDPRRYYLLDANPKVPAGAKMVEGSYAISPKANGRVSVEASGGKTTNGTNIRLYSDSNGKNQRIYLERDGSGYYTAWVVGTSKVLEVKDSSLIPGTNVIQWARTGKDNQKWALRSYDDGTYSLVNKATGLALGAAGNSSGSNLIATRNDGYKTTRFKFARKALISAGIVEIHPRTNKKVSLDVKKAASSGIADLLLYTDHNALNQRFEFVSAGSTDLWRIRTASSGGWLTGTSTGVVQSGNGSTAKTKANTWKVTFKGGWYSLVNVGTGKALAMYAGKTTSGTKIKTNPPSGSDAQHFSFESAQLIEPGVYMLKNGGSRYLTVAGSSTKSGANIQVNSSSGSMGQVFRLARNGSTWTIQNYNSGLYLMTETTEWGANVIQTRGGTYKRQQWKLRIEDGGSIGFTSAVNPKVSLYAAGMGAREGANVWVAKTAHNAGQSWKPILLLQDGALNAKQKRVIASAKSTPTPGGGLCALWVTTVFERAGIGWWGGDARDQYTWFCKSAELSKLRPGMIVAVSSHNKSWAGSIWGHVGIYVGDGVVMDNIGYIRRISVLDWIDYYGEVVKPKWGWFGKSLV